MRENQNISLELRSHINCFAIVGLALGLYFRINHHQLISIKYFLTTDGNLDLATRFQFNQNFINDDPINEGLQ